MGFLMSTKIFFSDIPSRTIVLQHKIIPTSNGPVRVTSLPNPLNFRKQENEEIQDILKLNIIEELD